MLREKSEKKMKKGPFPITWMRLPGIRLVEPCIVFYANKGKNTVCKSVIYFYITISQSIEWYIEYRNPVF